MKEINDLIENAVKLFTELISIQRHYAEKIEVPRLFFSKDEITRHYDNGEVFLSFLPVPFYDVKMFSEIKKEISSLIKKYRPGIASRVEEIDLYLCKNTDIFEEFLLKNRNIFGDRVPERELLGFIVYQTIRPLLQKYAEVIKAFSQHDEWLRDYCPVCGEKANISYLRREDGKRVLICPLCSTEWIYRYLACSWCSNDEPKNIRFFEVAEFPAYEVYICDSCHGYLKTFNEKKGFDHGDWMLEDIKTLPLDMLALKEGYNGPAQILLQ